jgi:hypothetical protein
LLGARLDVGEEIPWVDYLFIIENVKAERVDGIVIGRAVVPDRRVVA